MPRTTLALALAGCMTTAAMPAWAQTVKVTPLGSHEGEFCASDRALVFEDPDGTRILYDAGRTVRGPDDERLGEIDAVLLSHVHGDHLGDAITSGPDAGECGMPDRSVSATPNSNSVDIVVGKNAGFLVGGEMASFFEKKVAAAGGSEEQVQLVRFGGEREVGGVKVASVPAVHSNGISPDFLGASSRRSSRRTGSRPISARRAATCCSSATASWSTFRAIPASPPSRTRWCAGISAPISRS
jgi:hypothetical protein